MYVIWKFPLVLQAAQDVRMPRECTPLCVQLQDGALMLWAEVDSDAPLVLRAVDIVGTGFPVPPSAARSCYVGTVQTPPYVWHVYVEGGDQ